MPRLSSIGSKTLAGIGLLRIPVIPQIFYYPLTNTETDPTSANWRNNYAPAGYTFVPNDGIYTEGPITNMREMFSSDGSLQFNDPDISMWDVSTVTNMLFMFFSLQTLTQSLNSWDVSNVTNMAGMFRATFNYNQPLDNWDVGNVTNMSGMFDSTGFNQPIGMWNVSSVTNMGAMFAFSTFNQPIGFWDVSNVTNMENMFLGNNSFAQDLSAWCVTNITQEPSDFNNTNGSNPIWGTCSTELTFSGTAEITEEATNYSVTTSNYQFGYFDDSGGSDNLYLQLQTTDPYLQSLNPGDVIQINFESIPSITITVTLAFFNAGAFGGEGEWLISFTTTDTIPQSSEPQTSMQIFKTQKFYIKAPFGTADNMLEILELLGIGSRFEWTSIYSPNPTQRYPAIVLSGDLTPGGDWRIEIGTVLRPTGGSYGELGWEINKIFTPRP